MAEPAYSITIQGLPQLQAAFARFPAEASRATQAGLLAGAAIVQAAAKETVHSDSNPWSGSSNSGYKRPTGKLRANIRIGRVTGSGIGKTVAVGLDSTSSGQAFGRSVSGGKGRVNRGDVQVYGPIEEHRHPFLGPALNRNIDRISRAFWQRFDAALGVFRKAA